MTARMAYAVTLLRAKDTRRGRDLKMYFSRAQVRTIHKQILKLIDRFNQIPEAKDYYDGMRRYRERIEKARAKRERGRKKR